MSNSYLDGASEFESNEQDLLNMNKSYPLYFLSTATLEAMRIDLFSVSRDTYGDDGRDEAVNLAEDILEALSRRSDSVFYVTPRQAKEAARI